MKKSIDARFAEYHQLNPHVYDGLLRLTRQFKERGRGKIGIGLLVEVMRWETKVRTGSYEDFKITNDFKPLYARLIVAQNPDLDGIFDIHTMWRHDRASHIEPPNPNL